jgi:hypothetical protein
MVRTQVLFRAVFHDRMEIYDMHRIILAGITLAALTTSALAFGGWQPNGIGGFNGTGDNFGSGWQSNGIGGFNGTGNNFGSGWQSNGIGGFNGTGNNFGHRCMSNGIGGVNCY